MFWCLVLSVILGLLLLIRVVKSPLIAKLIASFDNSSDGFSARKLSAFTGVLVSVIATFRFVEPDTIIEALSVWLIFSLLCMGIITAEQIIRFYRLKKGQEEEQPKQEIVEESKQETSETTEQEPKI
jgi:uncharacterized membrane protein HdeD (DUF308 family)